MGEVGGAVEKRAAPLLIVIQPFRVFLQGNESLITLLPELSEVFFGSPFHPLSRHLPKGLRAESIYRIRPERRADYRPARCSWLACPPDMQVEIFSC